VIAAAIAILGFLGRATLVDLLPIGSLNTNILGEWQATDKPWHIVFRSDNTIGMSTLFGSLKPGTYRLDTSGTLWVDMQDGHRYKASVKMPNRNRMNLIDADGVFTSFERVP